MSETTAVFFDIGGVLLTNAWDRSQRQRSIEEFSLDQQDFEARHAAVVDAFESGGIGLDEYLDKTVFCQKRHFTADAFKAVMFAQSQPLPASLAFLADLANSRRYLLAAINNESRELNEYRIACYKLRRYFSAFFSSCYLGIRKPDPRIFRVALDITQRKPEECLFVDDRSVNVEAACRLGMRAVQFHQVDELRCALR